MQQSFSPDTDEILKLKTCLLKKFFSCLRVLAILPAFEIKSFKKASIFALLPI